MGESHFATSQINMAQGYSASQSTARRCVENDAREKIGGNDFGAPPNAKDDLRFAASVLSTCAGSDAQVPQEESPTVSQPTNRRRSYRPPTLRRAPFGAAGGIVRSVEAVLANLLRSPPPLA